MDFIGVPCDISILEKVKEQSLKEMVLLFKELYDLDLILEFRKILYKDLLLSFQEPPPFYLVKQGDLWCMFLSKPFFEVSQNSWVLDLEDTIEHTTSMYVLSDLISSRLNFVYPEINKKTFLLEFLNENTILSSSDF